VNRDAWQVDLDTAGCSLCSSMGTPQLYTDDDVSVAGFFLYRCSVPSKDEGGLIV